MRKIINILLAISIITTYGASGILEDATVNITPASTLEVKDAYGNTVSTAYYSGGGSVSFDFLEPPEPFLTFSPPSIEAGCNGIDIKGLFFNLLGIDQMGEMISNAGASLAYGVAVGLIYSLPGIAKAFAFIRKWATKIQQLLANACSSGIKIGMALGDMAGSSLPDLENTVNNAISKVDSAMASYLQKGVSGIQEALGIGDIFTSTVPEISINEKSAAIINFFKGAIQSDSSLLGIILTDLALKTKASSAIFEDLVVQKDAERAITATTFYIIAGNTAQNAIGDAKYAVGTDQLATAAAGSLTGKDMVRLNLFSYVLLYNFIGDIGISAPDPEKYNNLFEIASTVNPKSGSAATPEEREKTKEAYAKALKDNFVATTIMGPGAGIRSSKTAGKNLAEFIWMGTKASADRDPNRLPAVSGTQRIILNGNLKAPMATMYTITLENTPAKAFIPVLSNSEDTNTKYFQSETEKSFTGVLDQSTCIIEELVDGNGTIEGCGEVPFVYPEMHKYVKVIKNSPIFEKPRLKNVLVLSMAANMANALLYAIDNSYGTLANNQSKLVKEFGTGNDNPTGQGTTAKKTADMMMSLIDKKSKAMTEATRILREELSAGFEMKTKIEGIFTAQAVRNRERGLKSLQK